jgi:Heterokaryon incompatibility protein (HET)
MSKYFVRDTVIGNALGLPAGKTVPVPRWKRLWEYTGGAFMDGLTGDELEVESSRKEINKKWSDGYNADENQQNTEAGPVFRYDSLLDGSKHIRLLQILPGSPQDDVRCFMYPVALENCPEYEALSYCWGDTIDLTPIQVNEHLLDITQSLRSALFHLRKLDEPRTLWVDAICIDQQDPIERGNQVSIMGDIYSRASRTVVWLGSGDEETDRAFKICERLAEEAIILEALPDPSVDASNFPEYDTNDSCLQRLVDDCPWWKRVWIVQEIILAQDAILVCGSKEIDWKVFCRAINRLISAKLEDAVVLGLVEDDPFRWYKSIISMHSLISTESTGDKLLDLLIHVREREATNPRDKVFSVLGLMESKAEEMGIVPDYESSTEDVFKNATICILKNSSNLDILGLAPTNSSAQELPSWVPSWAYANQIAKPMRFDGRGTRRATHASRGTLPHLEFLDHCNVLVLSGHHIDILFELADVLPVFDKDLGWDTSPDPDEDAGAIAWFKSAFADLSQVSAHLLAITARLTTFVQWEKFVGSSKDQETAYWQTISGGCRLDDSTSMETLYREWHASLAPIRNLVRWRIDRVTTNNMFKSLGFIGYLKSTWTSYPEFGRLVEAQASGRRLARTAKGLLCLVPADTRKSDSIVLAKGGRVPLVIRPSEIENCAIKSWTLVGECYVHGIMDGEAFREEDCIEVLLR